MKFKYLAFLLVFILLGCIDPFNVAVNDDGSKLVVFAEITDQVEPYRVELTRTSNYTAANSRKESGARVSVLDSEGNEFMFTENKEGIYQSCPAEFTAAIGGEYVLRIVTVDDKIYESSVETIMPTGEIDFLYHERFTRYKQINGRARPENGLKIFCNFKDNPTKDFFRLDWEGTYQFRASPLEASYKQCWNTEYSKFDINLYSDQYSNNSVNKDYEVTFLAKGFRFKEGYSFKLKLKSMSQGAYDFWRLIKQQSESDGSIFAALPSQINSNIKCITNPEEKALGYFIVSAVATKRIRIRPSALGGSPIEAALGCAQFKPTDPVQEYCYDCTKFENSVDEKPSFW